MVSIALLMAWPELHLWVLNRRRNAERGAAGEAWSHSHAERKDDAGFDMCAQAVEVMHRPSSLDAADEARRRLAFDELLTMQVQLLLQRHLARCRTDTSHTVSPHLYCSRLLPALQSS